MVISSLYSLKERELVLTRSPSSFQRFTRLICLPSGYEHLFQSSVKLHEA